MNASAQDFAIYTFPVQLHHSAPPVSETRFIAVDPGSLQQSTQLQSQTKVKQCSRCGTLQATTGTSGTWRNSSDGERLCNRCGLREQRATKGRLTGASVILSVQGQAFNRERSTIGSGDEPSPSDIESPILWNPLENMSYEVPREGLASDYPAVPGTQSSLSDVQIDTANQLPTAQMSTIHAPTNRDSTLSNDRNPGTSSRFLIQRVPRPQETTAGLFDGRTTVPYHNIEGADSLSLYAGASEHRSPGYLHQIFTTGENTLSHNLILGHQYWFYRFCQLTTDAHSNALQQGSTVYVAMETFASEYAGETWKFTAYAVLQELCGGVPSPSLGNSSWDTAQLYFHCVGMRATGYPDQLDDWLHGQSLVKRIRPLSAMSAIWDLTRLPVGSHHPLSMTFRYLRRSFHTMQTSVGPRTIPQISSGNPNLNFRSVHQITMILKHVELDGGLDIFKSLEPMLRDACIRSCQEWFIACLDEAARRYDRDQLDFLQANKEYMRDTIVLYRRSFEEIQVYNVPHICSFPCPTHVQPSFNGLVSAANDALDALFSQGDAMRYIRSPTPPILTQDQLQRAQTVGYVQYVLCFSCHLLSDWQRALHNDITWRQIADERAKLFQRTRMKLIWNYLPVDVTDVVSRKLDQALALHGFDSSTLFLCP